MKRALGSMRRLFRRRRRPGSSEQEWLRLILLVRRLQRGQFAFTQRLDEIRTLTAALGSFRSDLNALHEQLGAAHESAGELERSLAERMQRLDCMPDPAAGHAAIVQRLASLDAVAARLETIAGQVPAAQGTHELGALLERFSDLAARFEGVQAAERTVGGQEELAQLYERILELAEELAHKPPVDLSDSAFAREAGARMARMSHQLENLESSLQDLAESTGAATHKDTLARLEKLAVRLDRRSAGPGTAKEMTALLNRFEALANRMEQVPAHVPGPVPESRPAGPDPETVRALEELRVSFLCEQDARRRFEAELETARERLRASELARVELDTRHTAELAQMADHVGRQLQRVEEDLKKKKRGLAELTQQNIALQNEVARLGGAAVSAGSAPQAPLPRSSSGPLSQLMRAEPAAEPPPDPEG